MLAVPAGVGGGGGGGGGGGFSPSSYLSTFSLSLGDGSM